jgi:branched-chain amino acid transport system substrate-binding protein
MKPVYKRFILCFAFLFALSATPIAQAALAPLVVDVFFPLTGFGAFFGTPQVQALTAIESAVNKTGGINGHPLHFAIHDDATNPQVDVQFVNDAISRHVNVMLGPDTAGQCNAVMPLLKDGPTTFCLTTTVHPAAGGFAFASGASTEYIMDASLRYLAARGLHRIAIITSTDATGQDADRQLTAAIARNSAISVVDRQYFNGTDVSVSAQMAHIKASSPQALVVWSTGTPFGTVLRGVQEAALGVPVLSGSGNLLYGELKQFDRLMPEELIFPGNPYLVPDTITDRDVADSVRVMYTELAALGAKPDQGHNSVWDAALLVVAALKKLGPAATASNFATILPPCTIGREWTDDTIFARRRNADLVAISW